MNSGVTSRKTKQFYLKKTVKHKETEEAAPFKNPSLSDEEKTDDDETMSPLSSQEDRDIIPPTQQNQDYLPPSPSLLTTCTSTPAKKNITSVLSKSKITPNTSSRIRAMSPVCFNRKTSTTPSSSSPSTSYDDGGKKCKLLFYFESYTFFFYKKPSKGPSSKSLLNFELF